MSRRHDIDALRVIAFGLLIVYHVAMAYVGDWPWHVKSSYQTDLLQWPMLFLNRWRMGLLFLISGLAIGLARVDANPGRFAWARTGRLLVPLLFGMIAIVPAQAYCQAVANGSIAPGFGDFLHRYFTFQPWPEKAFDGWEHGFTWNHLWYLAYVWVYTMLLMLLQPLRRLPLVRRAADAFNGLRGARLVIVPGLFFVALLVLLGQRFPGTNDLVHDWFNHAEYFSLFLIGYTFSRGEALWSELARLRQRLLLTTLLVFFCYCCANQFLPEQPTALQMDGVYLFRGFYMWSALLTVLGYGHAYLNRPFRWLPYATEAVFPWYVLHQSVIVVLVYWLAPKQLGALWEPVLVLGGTVGLCFVLHEFLIRRVGVLRPLFGLKAKASPAKTRRAPASLHLNEDTA